ncbi:MAG: ABC transporter ATP-binding protein [Chloroflexota bacterium]|nr:ABC transporter ATP-binding protein [Chloroflexota bacterium]MDQ5866052.1 ABC transporter ATP-binding protein [Chloroflexota bacterium]
METPKIQIDNLKVVYPGRGATGPVEALRGVTLHVPEGELICIVGPSGCGKTTLLRVLAGLEQPASGTASIRHDDPNRPAMSMVFQGAGIFPWLTVEQNVAYGLQLRGVERDERLKTARHWIREMGLDRFSRSYPAQLSGGMRQRVGLARALAVDAEVLLMDEPFGALDAQTRLILQQTLLEQWERNAKTVIFVTHSIEEALTLGDRVYVMSARPGQLLNEFQVPFERPRDAVALRTDPRFSTLFADIWEVLREEVDRARLSEMGSLTGTGFESTKVEVPM